ncbi:MAG: site-specific integrase [Bacteroidota bacterium]
MFLSRRSNGIYFVCFDDDRGKRRRISTGCRRWSEAIKFFRNFKEEEYKKTSDRISISEFAKSYLAFSATTHAASTQEIFKYAFIDLERTLGDVPLDKISVKEIDMFIAMKRKTSDWTAKRLYLHLASAFEKAVKWGHITKNVFRSVEKPKPRETQPVYFTKQDFLKLLAVIQNDDFREFCLTAVSTGLRLGELTSLEWNNLDFARKVIFIRNSATFTTKGRKNRVVPMNEPLLKLLSERKQKASCGLVFHSNGVILNRFKVSQRFKQYVREAKLDDKLHFHSLRHTFATWLVQEGVSIYEVQKLLGHTSIAVTQIYSHLAASELHGAVNKIALLGEEKHKE